MNISLYTLTSPLHDEDAVNAASPLSASASTISKADGFLFTYEKNKPEI
jgi:hypothetical protein